MALKTQIRSKAYLNCVEVYNLLYRDWSEDVLNGPLNIPEGQHTTFLTFPKGELEKAIGMIVGIDDRTLETYTKWLIKFNFMRRINPHSYSLLKIKDTERQLKLPVGD